MAILSNFNSDLVEKGIFDELDRRYGKGKSYRNFNIATLRDTFVHISEDNIKRTMEFNKPVFEDMRGGDPLTLIEIVHDVGNHHPMTFPDYPINPAVSPASILAERDSLRLAEQERKLIKHYNINKEPIPPLKEKKKSKRKDDIKTILQKETDEWLKNCL